MKILSVILALSLYSITVLAQEVPHKIDFANMELKLSNDAIRDIQTDVDALTRSEKYFQIKLERVDMYMPIIERIFAEEGLPDDFKYLVIQESALISDAVSSSNAVGFWQFKEISGLENDLRIDRSVDERKNIVSATRAAANYLKNHNKVFDNWAYALIAYQRGVGGAKSVIDERYYGAKKMPITKNTYWYLKKYLAHKIAFEAVLGSSKPTYYLLEKNDVQGESLANLAKEYEVDVELLKEYNKWLEKSRIPEDKNYTVIIPLTQKPNETPYHDERKDPFNNIPQYDNTGKQAYINTSDKVRKNASIAHEIKVNGLDAIVAAEGYTIASLAEKAGLSEKKFRRLNDMSIKQKIQVGEIYYIERKLSRAKYYYHTVYPGESMWEISQKYGLKLHKLYRKNRMKDPAKPTPGRVLWLRLNRPSSVEIEYRAIEQQKITTKTKQPVDPTETREKSEAVNQSFPEVKQNVADTASTYSNESIEPINNTSVDDSTAIAELTNKPIDDKIILKDSTLIINNNSTTEDTNIEIQDDSAELMDYEIKKGDTFFSIANKFNMKISELLAFNELSIKDTLSIGQIIVVNKIENAVEEISKNDTLENDQKTGEQKKHTVKTGETLYGIAKLYNVSLDNLLKWNDKEGYSIKEGEIIIIKLNN